MTMICLRPLSASGYVPSTREARDKEREKDSMRCCCGQPECRDQEVTKR